jgi:phosphopantothenoylcysteine decarboxylase / phosphopantothenate---cysteine ligase
MTRSAAHFITPLSLGALSGHRVLSALFSLDDEHDIGHIALSRAADLIVVAPATADLMAKMAGGHADDLATTVLLATNKPVLIAPAMNPKMWSHPATQRNLSLLLGDSVHVIGPEAGEMAERGEAGLGRMAEPLDILGAAEALLSVGNALAGRHVLVTSGPTHEPIDPVRYIANRSSGKQGHAIAAAAAKMGARVTLVSGPTALADPDGVGIVRVETARDMHAAVLAALPADIAIFAAAVADWGVADTGAQKLKKAAGSAPPALKLEENPDILAAVSALATQRPKLVIGFAAETENVIEHAKAKRTRKGCDWIVANNVSLTAGITGGVFAGEANQVHLITQKGVEDWPIMSKAEVAERLLARLAVAVQEPSA